MLWVGVVNWFCDKMKKWSRCGRRGETEELDRINGVDGT